MLRPTSKRRNRLSRLADEELMQLVSEKDADAFELFYDRHSGSAYSLAHRILGDRALAEDVIQEAFLSIWRSRSGYDTARGSVRSWTLGVVRNRAIDTIRRQMVRPQSRSDVDPHELLERQPAALATGTEAEAMRNETAGELRGALAELPSEQSRVIELAYFGGFSQSEIAQMLGMPLGTVKGRMRLGLEKIRSIVAESLQ
ncbi:MAG: hypothetical protein QOJ38_1496 [Solirubrobacterales bacterium]|jgi:RNA polymerase sigma-70 factor (ECF subfamily)|nr:hypothetical protein [Solirubrobacterales bacterium]